jgi:hypothetical protein
MIKLSITEDSTSVTAAVVEGVQSSWEDDYDKMVLAACEGEFSDTFYSLHLEIAKD